MPSLGFRSGWLPAAAGIRATASWLLARLTDRSHLPLELELRRPRLALRKRPRTELGRPKILALGIFLGTEANTAADVTRRLSECTVAEVVQDWTAVCRRSADGLLDRRTAGLSENLRPKYELLGRALARHELSSFDFLLIVDDDILLPYGFLDDFLAVQKMLDFAIAQPARTSNSYIDLPIVERHPGLLARRTLFVEQGPVVCFRRDSFDFVVPFDPDSPMGWGFENVWSLCVEERSLRMGIVDAIPVDHSLRRPVAFYDWAEADRGRSRLFANRAHRPTDDCFRVIEAIALDR